MSENEWAVTEDDLKGGGGGDNAKPRGKYTGTISRVEKKTDKNGLLFIGFGLSVTHPVAYKKQLSFDNYLVLSAKANNYQKARRNSFFQAIGLEAGSIPPGAPGGPDVSVLEGVSVDFNIEHLFEDVPGEDYDLTTSKSSKQPWKADGWEEKLDSNGNLVVDGTKIAPREAVTFYSVSDDFEGLSEPGSGSGEESADDDSWG